MAWTIEEVLRKNPTASLEKQEGSEFQFKIGSLTPVVAIRLLKDSSQKGAYFFEQSHHIKTPKQASPYKTSRPWGDYEAYALHLALRGLTEYFDEALKLGYTPDDTWLVPNENF